MKRIATGLAALALLAGTTALPAKDTATAAAANFEDPSLFVREDVRAMLRDLKAHPRPEMTAQILAMIRKMPDITSPLDLPVGELGMVKDVTMPGPGGPIKLRLYDPRASRGPGPVVVFYHGGGFVVGSMGTHGGLAAEMARGLDLPVVFVDYRLAPEHPWPAAPDDAEAAARWIAANGNAFDRQFTGLVLTGDSAGGTLTIVTALALRDRKADLPVLVQFPIYPAGDLAAQTESKRLFAQGFGLDAGSMALYRQHYRADPKNWRASPLLADQAGLPPTLVLTGGLDPLRDEGRAYAAKTALAGVPTVYREGRGLVHGFATYRKVIPSASRDLAEALAVAKAMIAEAQQPPAR